LSGLPSVARHCQFTHRLIFGKLLPAIPASARGHFCVTSLYLRSQSLKWLTYKVNLPALPVENLNIKKEETSNKE
jgi:hypothetical protein